MPAPEPITVNPRQKHPYKISLDVDPKNPAKSLREFGLWREVINRNPSAWNTIKQQLPSDVVRRVERSLWFKLPDAKLPPKGDWSTWIYAGSRISGADQVALSWIIEKIKQDKNKGIVITKDEQGLQYFIKSIVEYFAEPDETASGIVLEKPEVNFRSSCLRWAHNAKISYLFPRFVNSTRVFSALEHKPDFMVLFEPTKWEDTAFAQEALNFASNNRQQSPGQTLITSVCDSGQTLLSPLFERANDHRDPAVRATLYVPPSNDPMGHNLKALHKLKADVSDFVDDVLATTKDKTDHLLSSML